MAAPDRVEQVADDDGHGFLLRAAVGPRYSVSSSTTGTGRQTSAHGGGSGQNAGWHSRQSGRLADVGQRVDAAHGVFAVPTASAPVGVSRRVGIGR